MESPGAAVATLMSWYTVDTRMSGGSVRVILKATLLPPVPCLTASEDGSPPCKRTHEVPQSWSDLISLPTSPGSELGIGHLFRNEKFEGIPASTAAVDSQSTEGRNWKESPDAGCKSRSGWQDTHGGKPGNSAYQLSTAREHRVLCPLPGL